MRIQVPDYNFGKLFCSNFEAVLAKGWFIMLEVYKISAIPKGTEVIKVNDIFFNKYTAVLLNDRAKDIIKEIDNSEMINQYSIKSRFDGTVLNVDKLSTGCKTALNILYNPDKIINIFECGDNAIDVIYGFDEGKVCCEYPLISFDIVKVKAVDKKESRVIDSYEKLKEWWLDED